MSDETLYKGLTKEDIDTLIGTVRATPAAQIHLLNSNFDLKRISGAIGDVGEKPEVTEIDRDRDYLDIHVDLDWRIVPEETHTGGATFVNPWYSIKAYVKWDGSLHVWIDDNGYHDEPGQPFYWCAGDLNGTIAALQALREKALRYLGGNFEGNHHISKEERLQRIAEFEEEQNAAKRKWYNENEHNFVRE